MKTKLKLHPNTILALCVLGVALLVNIVAVIVNSTSSENTAITNYGQTVLPLNILDFVKVGLIFLMAYFIFSIIKKVLRKEKWNPKYYVAIKRIGWLSILVVLLDSVSAIAREQYIYKNEPLSEIFSRPGIFTNIISQTVFSSPVAWFLICCIFLLADVLQYAGTMKNENESFI